VKRILPLALLLALAVPVGAEQEKYGCAITPEGRACLFSDRQIAQMERDQYCLATMEAAMKLMDQYLPLDVAFRVINWKREHPGEWTSVLLDELAAVQRSQQWDAAKACWREKPCRLARHGIARSVRPSSVHRVTAISVTPTYFLTIA